jgi:hypothetical protein
MKCLSNVLRSLPLEEPQSSLLDRYPSVVHHSLLLAFFDGTLHVSALHRSVALSPLEASLVLGEHLLRVAHGVSSELVRGWLEDRVIRGAAVLAGATDEILAQATLGCAGRSLLKLLDLALEGGDLVLEATDLVVGGFGCEVSDGVAVRVEDGLCGLVRRWWVIRCCVFVRRLS